MTADSAQRVGGFFYIVQIVHLIHSLARLVRFGLVIHSDNSFIYPIRLVRFVQIGRSVRFSVVNVVFIMLTILCQVSKLQVLYVF